MVYIRQNFISWSYLVRCPANVITLHIAQLLCYCEKNDLCSLLDSGRKIFYWSKLTMPSQKVQPCLWGRSAGYFPKQWLVIEPTYIKRNIYLLIDSFLCELSTKAIWIKMEIAIVLLQFLSILEQYLSNRALPCLHSLTRIWDSYVNPRHSWGLA